MNSHVRTTNYDNYVVLSILRAPWPAQQSQHLFFLSLKALYLRQDTLLLQKPWLFGRVCSWPQDPKNSLHDACTSGSVMCSTSYPLGCPWASPLHGHVIPRNAFQRRKAHGVNDRVCIMLNVPTFEFLSLLSHQHVEAPKIAIHQIYKKKILKKI